MKAASRARSEEVEIFPSGGGYRWRYVDRREDRVLMSNEEFFDHGSARHAARTAYPKLPLVDLSAETEQSPRKSFVVLLLLCITVIGLVALLLREV